MPHRLGTATHQVSEHKAWVAFESHLQVSVPSFAVTVSLVPQETMLGLRPGLEGKTWLAAVCLHALQGTGKIVVMCTC